MYGMSWCTLSRATLCVYMLEEQCRPQSQTARKPVLRAWSSCCGHVHLGIWNTKGTLKPVLVLVVSGDRLGTSNPNLTPPAAWFRVLQEHRTRVSGSGLSFGFLEVFVSCPFSLPFL